MRNIRAVRSVLFVLLSLAIVVPAQDWRTTRQARTVVNRLITNTNSFQSEIQRNRYPWDTNSNSDETLSTMVSAFSNALNSLRTSLTQNGNTSDELDGVLTRAS